MNLEAVHRYVDAPNFRIVSSAATLSHPEHFEFALELPRATM